LDNYKEKDKDNILQTSIEDLPPSQENNLLPLDVKKENTLTLGGAKKNDVDNRKLKFRDSLLPFMDEYGKETLTDFYNHWTETSKNGLSFRMESEKFFDIKKRLNTWQRNGKTFNKTEKKTKLENNITSIQESLNMTPNTNNTSYELPN